MMWIHSFDSVGWEELDVYLQPVSPGQLSSLGPDQTPRAVLSYLSRYEKINWSLIWGSIPIGVLLIDDILKLSSILILS